MSNYVVLKNGKMAFHPGYYIEEYLEETGLTQEDFAKRLGTTPKNISLLIRGNQRLSVDIASKLSRMMGTSIKVWLNLQSEFDALIAEDEQDNTIEEELKILEKLDYNYFTKNFGLKELPRKKKEQVVELRTFLNVASLEVFANKDMFVRFRGSISDDQSNIIKANIMVQIATNIALNKTDTPKFNKQKLDEAIEYALTITNKPEEITRTLKAKLYDAGINLVLLPHLSGSKINGATKIINKHVMLMISDRNHYSDSFWFTLFHEIGHIVNGDFGISFENEKGIEEDNANTFAQDKLIPKDEYNAFINKKQFSAYSVKNFAKSIERNVGIVVGRLEKEKYISYGDPRFKNLKQQYTIEITK
ncbi:MAG: HigA family addiction module antidote protein [Bacilli bacterium]|nr:HigA family addiction module antidote protein [Bacilli bacterium]